MYRLNEKPRMNRGFSAPQGHCPNCGLAMELCNNILPLATGKSIFYFCVELFDFIINQIHMAACQGRYIYIESSETA